MGGTDDPDDELAPELVDEQPARTTASAVAQIAAAAPLDRLARALMDQLPCTTLSPLSSDRLRHVGTSRRSSSGLPSRHLRHTRLWGFMGESP